MELQSKRKDDMEDMKKVMVMIEGKLGSDSTRGDANYVNEVELSMHNSPSLLLKKEGGTSNGDQLKGQK